MQEVTIYTDGSCLGNPGPGGWAAILILKNTKFRREISGGYRLTTNNRMEIIAAIEALKILKSQCVVELYTDSQYLCNAIEKGWLAKWQKNNWVKSDKKPVLNVDLWNELSGLLRTHQVSILWQRGHCGHPENERCDFLARSMAQQSSLPADMVFEKLQSVLNRN